MAVALLAMPFESTLQSAAQRKAMRPLTLSDIRRKSFLTSSSPPSLPPPKLTIFAKREGQVVKSPDLSLHGHVELRGMDLTHVVKRHSRGGLVGRFFSPFYPSSPFQMAIATRKKRNQDAKLNPFFTETVFQEKRLDMSSVVKKKKKMWKKRNKLTAFNCIATCRPSIKPVSQMKDFSRKRSCPT